MLCKNGVMEAKDFMYHPPKPLTDEPFMAWIVRTITVIRGETELNIECCPSFNYALSSHKTEILSTINNKQNGVECLDCVLGKDIVEFKSKELDMDLRYVINSQNKILKDIKWDKYDIEGINGPGVKTIIKMGEGDTVTFIFREIPTDNIKEMNPKLCCNLIKTLLCDTRKFWHDWLQTCTYKGKWREIVERSAMILKLLSFEPVLPHKIIIELYILDWCGNSSTYFLVARR